MLYYVKNHNRGQTPEIVWVDEWFLWEPEDLYAVQRKVFGHAEDLMWASFSYKLPGLPFLEVIDWDSLAVWCEIRKTTERLKAITRDGLAKIKLSDGYFEWSPNAT